MARPAAAAAAAPASTPSASTFPTIAEFAERLGVTPAEVVESLKRTGLKPYEFGAVIRLGPAATEAIAIDALHALRASYAKTPRPGAAGEAKSQLAELRTDVADLKAEVAAVRRTCDASAALLRAMGERVASAGG